MVAADLLSILVPYSGLAFPAIVIDRKTNRR